MAWLAIGCFLVSSGADIHHKNRADKSPIDEVADPNVKQLLQKLVKYVSTPYHCIVYVSLQIVEIHR